MPRMPTADPAMITNVDRDTALIYGLILGLPFAVANFLLGGVLYRQGQRQALNATFYKN